MSTTPTSPTAEDWQRLGKAIEDRRFERGYSQEALVKRGGPSHQTVRNVERGLAAEYRPTTFRKFDRALDWRDGTTEKILAGTATDEDLSAVALRSTGQLQAIVVGQSSQPRSLEVTFSYFGEGLVPVPGTDDELRVAPGDSLTAVGDLLQDLGESWALHDQGAEPAIFPKDEWRLLSSKVRAHVGTAVGTGSAGPTKHTRNVTDHAPADDTAGYDPAKQFRNQRASATLSGEGRLSAGLAPAPMTDLDLAGALVARLASQHVESAAAQEAVRAVLAVMPELAPPGSAAAEAIRKGVEPAQEAVRKALEPTLEAVRKATAPIMETVRAATRGFDQPGLRAVQEALAAEVQRREAEGEDV